MATVKKSTVIIPAIPRIFEKQPPKAEKEQEKQNTLSKVTETTDQVNLLVPATTEKVQEIVSSAVGAELPGANSPVQHETSSTSIRLVDAPASTYTSSHDTLSSMSETEPSSERSDVTAKPVEPISVVHPITPIRGPGRVEMSKPEWLSTGQIYEMPVFGSIDSKPSAALPRTAASPVAESPSSSNSPYAGSTHNSDGNVTSGSQTSVSNVANTPQEKEAATFPEATQTQHHVQPYEPVVSAKTVTAHTPYVEHHAQRPLPPPVQMTRSGSQQSHPMMPSRSYHSHAPSFHRRESHEQMSVFSGPSSPLHASSRMDVEYMASFTSYIASQFNDPSTADCLIRIELRTGMIDIHVHGLLFAQHPYNRNLLMNSPHDGSLKTLRFTDKSGFVTEHTLRAAVQTFYGVSPRVFLDQTVHQNGVFDLPSTLSFLVASYLMHSDAAIRASLSHISTMASITQVPSLLEFVIAGPAAPPCLATDDVWHHVGAYLSCRSASAMAGEVYNLVRSLVLPRVPRSFRIDTSVSNIPSLGGFPSLSSDSLPRGDVPSLLSRILLSVPFVLLRDLLLSLGDRILAIEVLRERESRRRAAKKNGGGMARSREFVAVSDRYMTFWSAVEEE